MKNHCQFSTIVFDLDDTILYRPTDAIDKANRAALNLLCSDKYSIEQLQIELKSVYALTTKDQASLTTKKGQFMLLLRRLGITYSEELLFEEYISEYLSLIEPVANTKQVLAVLTRKGVKLGIATNGPEDTVERVLLHFTLKHFFDFVLTASSIGFPKPSKEFSSRLLAQASTAPDKILVVGDGVEDAETAKFIGANFALASFERMPQNLIKSNWVLNNLEELLELCTEMD